MVDNKDMWGCKYMSWESVSSVFIDKIKRIWYPYLCLWVANSLAWTKNSKLGVDGSLTVANDVSTPKERFDKISIFFEKKNAECSAFLVYDGIYNGKISKNLKL